MTASTPVLREKATPSPGYNNAIGYLRGFIVVLVVAHHAALAYHPFAPPPGRSLLAEPRWWPAFPVVDSHRWDGVSIITGFNDIFFMSLLFLLSGLFVWNGIERKGGATFLLDRLKRLGLPFIVVAAFVAPLAYYPTYLQMTSHSDVAQFWRQWLSLGTWPAGPAWFLWVLLAFDAIAVLLFVLSPNWGTSLGRLLSRFGECPLMMFALMAGVSAVVYVPLTVAVSPLSWSAIGPFAFQTGRIFHYLAYFIIGVGIGAWGLAQGLLQPDGKLARRWFLWAVRAALAFGIASVVTIIAITAHAQSLGWTIAYDAMFSVSCAASCLAFLALFLRFARSRSRVFESLSRNSFVIYLVHYAFVSWLQYALLPADLSGAVKFLIVFGGAVALSWVTGVVLRRIPVVTRAV